MAAKTIQIAHPEGFWHTDRIGFVYAGRARRADDRAFSPEFSRGSTMLDPYPEGHLQLVAADGTYGLQTAETPEVGDLRHASSTL